MDNEDWEIKKSIKCQGDVTDFRVTKEHLEIKQENDHIVLGNDEIVVLKQAIEKYEGLSSSNTMKVNFTTKN